MHRFVKGMPQFKIPTDIEGCPIFLAATLCKAPAGKAATTRVTTCNKGLSINFFGCMVQRSCNSEDTSSLMWYKGSWDKTMLDFLIGLEEKLFEALLTPFSTLILPQESMNGTTQ
jgi:hypothetical protein